jgi:RNA polymerase sigma-70 factor (ECF subfamily)
LTDTVADRVIGEPALAVACPAADDDEMHRRIRELVDEYMDFVWRSLRRLGVAASDCDDGCQRVWVVLAQKLPSVEPSKVRSYVFSVVVRVASEMRRHHRRHQHLELDELHAPTRPEAEGHLERQRVLELLDQILAGLGWELRTVFIMYEIEGMSSKEIAEVLGISRGTVASRLRLGREAFQRNLQRHRARTQAIRPSPRPVKPGSGASGNHWSGNGSPSQGAVGSGATGHGSSSRCSPGSESTSSLQSGHGHDCIGNGPTRKESAGNGSESSA